MGTREVSRVRDKVVFTSVFLSHQNSGGFTKATWKFIIATPSPLHHTSLNTKLQGTLQFFVIKLNTMAESEVATKAPESDAMEDVDTGTPLQPKPEAPTATPGNAAGAGEGSLFSGDTPAQTGPALGVCTRLTLL